MASGVPTELCVLAKRIWKKLRHDVVLIRTAYDLIKTSDDSMTKFEAFAKVLKG
jgi:hypothetical protein